MQLPSNCQHACLELVPITLIKKALTAWHFVRPRNWNKVGLDELEASYHNSKPATIPHLSGCDTHHLVGFTLFKQGLVHFLEQARHFINNLPYLCILNIIGTSQPCLCAHILACMDKLICQGCIFFVCFHISEWKSTYVYCNSVPSKWNSNAVEPPTGIKSRWWYRYKHMVCAVLVMLVYAACLVVILQSFLPQCLKLCFLDSLYSHVKLAPGWALIWLNLDSIQKIGSERGQALGWKWASLALHKQLTSKHHV